ncbi:PAS domain S-box protein [Phenylobacterium sp. LjRoot219]|uniref:sensor histidine kinase n=1 Tax=Phenylobacterium sp. LjRoot219 TaxID=3342283 RepID=UPI003ECD31B0
MEKRNGRFRDALAIKGRHHGGDSMGRLGADRARQIVEGLTDGFLGLDADWRITDCNNVIAGFLNRRREDLPGQKLCDVFAAGMDSPLGALVRRVAETQAAAQAEVSYPQHGKERLLHLQVFPLDGGIGAVWRDITEIRAAEMQLAESEAKYRELADGTPAAAWLTRPDGELEFINPAMAEVLGRSREALLADGWLKAIDPNDRPSLLKARAEAWASHSAFNYEGRFRHADGASRILELYGRPRFDNSGAFRGYVGMATDVTDRREAERRQKLLVDELNHRVKNALTTVQSMIRQTLRKGGGAKEMEHLLTDRLQALAAAHDVLSRESWDGADLADIAIASVKPLAEAGQMTIEGPGVRVAPNVAIALSMALHELATNARNYGALSTPTGQVKLSWTKAGRTVALAWRESKGPAVTAPDQEGFGSRLLGRGLAGELGQAAELIYAPDGLVCRIRAPVVG